MSALIFVYGTLKRGCSNHAQLAAQEFVGEACTVAGFTLVDLGGYPGLVGKPGVAPGVTGEVWRVDPVCLARLDEFEGLAQNLYRRGAVRLAAPFEGWAIDAYFPVLVAPNLPEVGPTWRE